MVFKGSLRQSPPDLIKTKRAPIGCTMEKLSENGEMEVKDSRSENSAIQLP